MRDPVGVASLAMVLFSLALLSGQPSPAVAQTASTCRQVEVLGVRLRRVDLYTLRGEYDRTVARGDLGGVSSATQCDAAPDFLRVEVDGARWLVRRSALQFPPSIDLPSCSGSQHDSGESRNASSSGAGPEACSSN